MEHIYKVELPRKALFVATDNCSGDGGIDVTVWPQDDDGFFHVESVDSLTGELLYHEKSDDLAIAMATFFHIIALDTCGGHVMILENVNKTKWVDGASVNVPLAMKTSLL